MYFLVDHEHKFLIGWSAKAGCTAIKQWYASALDLDVPDNPDTADNPIHEFIGYGDSRYTDFEKRWRPGLYKGYKKICLIRDPFRRLVSGYVNKYVVEELEQFPVAWDSFQEFVEILVKDKDYKVVNKHHFIPQTKEDFGGLLSRRWRWDLVIDLPELSDKVDELNCLTALHGTIGIVNRVGYGRNTNFDKEVCLMSIEELREYLPSYQYYYNDYLIELTKKQYSSDFKYFAKLGYEYSPPVNPFANSV